MVYLCDNCNRYPCADDDHKMRYRCPGFLAKPKPITNADRIRNMSDEELANLLMTVNHVMYMPQRLLDWLKQEAEDG